SATVFLLGAATLAEYFLHVVLGIDTLFVSDAPTPMQPFPRRPSPGTPGNFVLLPAALILFSRSDFGAFISQVTAGIVFAIAFIAFTGFVFGSQVFYGFPIELATIDIAVHTALSFVLLSTALLCTRPQRGVMNLILSDTRGSIRQI